ncbi:MAG: ATP-binding cassette domain-containing protein, partial [Synergistaceae bacterium]|nr:ATP-binding cassette domain-containing protein [Synergistaceae bacterium]
MASSFKAVNLFKRFKKRLVVDDVSLVVNTGEIVGLLGPNGAGKSTTFYMMVGRILPDTGQVTIGERNAGSLPMYERARMGVGYLPQEPSVFRSLSVKDNLRLVLRTNGTEKAEAEAECERLI